MHGHRSRQSCSGLITILSVALALEISVARADDPAAQVKPYLDKIGVKAGICAVVGDAAEAGPLAIGLAKESKLLIYVQVADDQGVAAIAQLADKEGLLGQRIWVAKGTMSRLHLADNLADAVIVAVKNFPAGQAAREDLLRTVTPGGKLLIGEETISKPFPTDSDDWSHPYHSPDNNPLSADQKAQFPYMTQFLAEPWYGPMLQVTVASGGRMFKAFGAMSVKTREQAWLCKLVAMNGYNGTILWTRDLSPGFMIHRNTLIATPTSVYVGDDTSCKVLDAATGELKDEITVPADADGPTWKWMAIQDGVLYAMVGEKEYIEPVHKLSETFHGWQWSAPHIGKGYFMNPYPWGFGHTLLAINLADKEVLWSQKEDKPLDGRAICMRDGRIYTYSGGAFLSCRTAKDGKEAWRNTDKDLLAAIGRDNNAASFGTGWPSTAFIKCTDKAIYFAGPQRSKLVAASAENGKLLWTYDKTGNFHLIIRPEAVYAMGAQAGIGNTSFSFDPLTGKQLAELGFQRRGCTRATGTVDSIFLRSTVGTLRFDLATQKPSQVQAMRPPCTDGVLVANGQLYWGPWACDCPHSLIGTICLAPAGGFKVNAPAVESERLESSAGGKTDVAPLPMAASPADWPTYRADNTCTCGSTVAVPEKVQLAWTYTPKSPCKATAPVAAGGLVFVSGADGVVRALEAATGTVKWSAFVGGPVTFPPTIADGRAFVGGGDGYVYCLEAATGRQLWRFRAAPIERRIPLYGSLASTWPVATGVLVDKGVAYAACGIANYDGTHVYALDAATGKLRWQNNTSGCLDPQQNTGVSVQGHLLLSGDRLHMAGGNLFGPVISVAYDIHDGTFAGEKPAKFSRGKELFLAGGEVRGSGHLLYAPDNDSEGAGGARNIPFGAYASPVSCAMEQPGRGWDSPVFMTARPAPVAPSTQPGEPLWQKKLNPGNTDAIAVAKNVVIVAWLGAGNANRSVEALDIATGKQIWQQVIRQPARPVDFGIAIDRDGRVLVALRDGRVLCFAPGK